MSPASQGALEVERYIGSCLISSNVRAGLLHGKSTVCRKQQQEQSATIRGKARGSYNNGQAYPLGGDQQCQVQYNPGGWTGAPLISMTSSPRRCNQRSSPSLGQQQQQQQTCTDQQQQILPAGQLHKSPLSRLAIHTQGAPLILTGRFYNRGKVHSNNGNSNNNGSPNGIGGTLCAGNYGSANPSMTSNVVNGATRCPASRVAAQRPAEVIPKKPSPTATNPKTSPDCTAPGVAAGKETTGSSNIANIDSLSIASDESSGSNNSENSLPRIIKPRKRRKKDRKPPNNVVAGACDVVAKPDESQQRQLSSIVVEAATSGVVVGAKPSYAPACYEPRVYGETTMTAVVPPQPQPSHLRNYRRPPLGHRENVYGVCRTPSMQEVADVRQRYAHHRHAQVKVLDDNRNVLAPMRGAAPPRGYRHHHHHHHHHHHVTGNANGNCNGGNNSGNHHHLARRYVHEYGDSTTAPAGCEEIALRDELTGACQCRYCDPSGLIWDVDRNGYSPFLTTPPASGVEYCRGHYGQMPLFLPGLQRQERALDRLFVDEQHPHGDVRDAQGPAGVVLRRSWSDPTSYFSYEEIAAPTRDVGVIGDRGQSEAGKRRTLWRGDSIGAPTTASSSSLTSTGSISNAGPNAVGGAASPPKGLEVSTEIITSPNGHRDLEIKFYSSPSPYIVCEEDKSSCHAEEVDEDVDDDFSDIWSYHESKLQQDFRTLLQAEE